MSDNQAVRGVLQPLFRAVILIGLLTLVRDLPVHAALLNGPAGIAAPQSVPCTALFNSPSSAEDETSSFGDFDYDHPEIYVREGFERHDTIVTTNFEVFEKGNEFKIIKDPDGNKVYRMQRTANDPLLDIYRQCEEDYGGGKWYPDDEWVVFEADFGFEKLGRVSLAALQSKSGKTATLITLERDGSLTAADGIAFDQVAAGEKHKYQCLVNFRAGNYSVFKDGTEILRHAPLGAENFGRLNKWRIYFWNENSNAALTLDNLAIYASDKVLDLSEYGGFEKVVFPQDETALQQAKGGAAFRDNSRYAVIGGERLRFEDAAVMDRENDRFYVPCSMAEACTGDEIPEEEQAQYAGRAYVELTQLADLKGWAHCFKRSGVDQDGLAIIAPTSLDGYRDGRESCRELNNYLQFERPKQARILEDFAATSKGQHPRIFVNKQQMEAMLERLKKGSQKQSGEKILASAENALGAGEMKCTYDGIRLVENTILPRVYNLSLAYLMTGDSRYRDRLWQDLKTYGDSQAAWAPGHFLSATQPAIAYAVAYDWLYESWAEEQRAYIAEILVTRSLNYAYMAMHGNWTYQVFWCKAPENDADELGNWPVICRAGQLTAALALMDEYPEFCADIVESSFRHIEYPIMEFCPDGAWEEGIAYWAYTLDHISILFAAASSALGTDYGYLDFQPIKDTLYFGLAMIGPQGVFGFGDADGREPGRCPTTAYFAYLAKGFQNRDYAVFRKKQRNAGSDSASVFDWAFLPEDITGGEALEGAGKDAYFKKLRTGSFFGKGDIDGTYVGYHCGSNLAGHMNYDSGTFVFDSMGIRWACELGRENYDCHDGYRTRAEGQNVFVINPGSGMGQEKNTPTQNVVKLEYGSSNALAIMDLSESYAKDASKAHRGIMLTDGRRSLVVRDEITLREISELYWFMHVSSSADVQVSGNTAILTQDGKQMKFEFIANQSLAVEVMEATQMPSSPVRDSREYDNAAYKKLALHGTGLSGDLHITVKLTPVEDGFAGTPVSEASLDTWTAQGTEFRFHGFAENADTGTVSAEGTIANDSGAPFKVVSILAGYRNGALCDADSRCYTVGDGQSQVCKNELRNRKGTSEWEAVKFFIWENGRMVPLDVVHTLGEGGEKD